MDNDLTPDLIKAYRLSRGLTQQAMATEMGISIAAVTAWEQGRRSPKGLYRVALLDAIRKHDRPAKP